LREETNSGHASFKKSPKRIDWKTTTSQNPHFVRLSNEQAINTLQNTTEDSSCGIVLSPAQQIQQKPRKTLNFSKKWCWYHRSLSHNSSECRAIRRLKQRQQQKHCQFKRSFPFIHSTSPKILENSVLSDSSSRSVVSMTNEGQSQKNVETESKTTVSNDKRNSLNQKSMVNFENQPSIHCQTEVVEIPHSGQRQSFRHYERESQELEYFSARRSNYRT
jgi:hypothetical protein